MQKFKKILGYSLLILSTVLWLGVIIVPFLDFELLEIAGWIAGIVIFSEVAFFLALLLLGKEAWYKIKAWIQTQISQLNSTEKK